jgi:hypothetical protein
MTQGLYGLIKAGKGALIGNAGEYFVVGELLRRKIAALAPRNAPGFDVIATEGSKSADIRVNTKTDAASSLVWNIKKDGSIFRDVSENDVTVLVDLRYASFPAGYSVFRTLQIERTLGRAFETWLQAPGREGHGHSPQNPQRRFGHNPGEPQMLQDARDRWEIIIERLRGDSL